MREIYLYEKYGLSDYIADHPCGFDNIELIGDIIRCTIEIPDHNYGTYIELNLIRMPNAVKCGISFGPSKQTEQNSHFISYYFRPLTESELKRAEMENIDATLDEAQGGQ